MRGGYYHPSAYLVSKLTLDASEHYLQYCLFARAVLPRPCCLGPASLLLPAAAPRCCCCSCSSHACASTLLQRLQSDCVCAGQQAACCACASTLHTRPSALPIAIDLQCCCASSQQSSTSSRFTTWPPSTHVSGGVRAWPWQVRWLGPGALRRSGRRAVRPGVRGAPRPAAPSLRHLRSHPPTHPPIAPPCPCSPRLRRRLLLCAHRVFLRGRGHEHERHG